jgi:hypothetical protein
MAVGDTAISVSVVLQLRAHRYLDARTNLDMARIYLENDEQINELDPVTCGGGALIVVLKLGLPN